MKKIFPLLFIFLFALQCEKGWLIEILNPTVEGCNISTACNYNPDVNKFDNSCEYVSCIDCKGMMHGAATIDSCGTCDAVEANDCEQDCEGKWGGVKTFDCNDTCGGEAKLDNCGTCDANPANDCNFDCTGIWGGTAEIDSCGVCNNYEIQPDYPYGSCDCFGTSNGGAFIDGCVTCIGGDTGLEACAADCAGVDGGNAYFNECGTCICTGLTDDCIASEDCTQGCDGYWYNDGNTPVIDECEVCGGNNSTCSDCNGVANGNAFIDPHYGEDNCIVNECVRGETGFAPCEMDCTGSWGGSAEIDICGVCGGYDDCEGIDCTGNPSDYCSDLEVLQDFIDSNTSLSGENPHEIGDQVWSNGRLTSLVLSFSQLTNIPGTIENLTALSELYLIGNQLKNLPVSICNLPNDCIINVGNNQLCEEFHFVCITGWGGQNQSECEGSIVCVDFDGNVYETIQLGNQLWMAENLKVTHYNDGSEIQYVQSESSEPDVWENLSTGAYGYYNDDLTHQETYGNLYNWYTVDDSRGLCMDGWHVPSDDEYKELEIFLGMSESEANSYGWRGTDEGSKLAGNSELWYNGDLENNPEFGTSGYTGLPAGYRSYDNGTFRDMGDFGYFWSSPETSSSNAWSRTLCYYSSNVVRLSFSKQWGFSIRCLKD